MDCVKEIIASRKIRKQNSKSARNIKDHEMISERVQFNGVKMDFVSEYIDRQFGVHVTTTPLIAFGNEMCRMYGLKLDRLAKRNRDALMCWYAENWNVILPHINNIVLYLPNMKIPELDKTPIRKSEKKLPHGISFQCSDPSDISQLLNYH